MFQLLAEENTTLVNCVQSWQGTRIKQQRLWVLLPTAVKNGSDYPINGLYWITGLMSY